MIEYGKLVLIVLEYFREESEGNLLLFQKSRKTLDDLKSDSSLHKRTLKEYLFLYQGQIVRKIFVKKLLYQNHQHKKNYIFFERVVHDSLPKILLFSSRTTEKVIGMDHLIPKNKWRRYQLLRTKSFPHKSSHLIFFSKTLSSPLFFRIAMKIIICVKFKTIWAIFSLLKIDLNIFQKWERICLKKLINHNFKFHFQMKKRAPFWKNFFQQIVN